MQTLPTIYIAGKVWHAGKFRQLRDAFSFDICSRWIDVELRTDDWEENCKDELWEVCWEDTHAGDLMVIYCGAEDEEQRGVIMEAGQMYGQNKPVYCINSCVSFSPCEISDVAFTHHRLWHWIKDDTRHISPLEGTSRALGDFIGCPEFEDNVIPFPTWEVER